MKVELLLDVAAGDILVPKGTILECKDEDPGFTYKLETEDHFENGYITSSRECFISKEMVKVNKNHFKVLDESEVLDYKAMYEELKTDYLELRRDYLKALEDKESARRQRNKTMSEEAGRGSFVRKEIDDLLKENRALKNRLSYRENTGDYNMWDNFWSYLN